MMSCLAIEQKNRHSSIFKKYIRENSFFNMYK